MKSLTSAIRTLFGHFLQDTMDNAPCNDGVDMATPPAMDVSFSLVTSFLKLAFLALSSASWLRMRFCAVLVFSSRRSSELSLASGQGVDAALLAAIETTGP